MKNMLPACDSTLPEPPVTAAVRISIDAAHDLVASVMTANGLTEREARIVAEHVVGCELRGVLSGGFSRALSIAERLTAGRSAKPMLIQNETPVSALIDGGDQAGYLVAHRATEIAIDKARTAGIAVVAANNTWYTGMFAHYMEMVTTAGLIAVCVGSSAPRVAPFGATEGRFGTNPIAFGFPTEGDPIIIDLATSGSIIGDLVLAARLGQNIREGVAYDAQGGMTTDPVAALAGALTVWGGHRGSALAIAVQMFGILAGGGALPADYRDCGFIVIALKPDLFMPAHEFRLKATDYARAVRGARPLDPQVPVRMPFDRSAEHRRQCLAEGALSVPGSIFASLTAAAHSTHNDKTLKPMP
jgi:delta1-piperideine-2-carboxylate reductase